MMEKSLLLGIHSPQIISNPNIQNCFKRDHVILGAHNTYKAYPSQETKSPLTTFFQYSLPTDYITHRASTPRV